MLIYPVFYLFIFIFGVCVGSFLNCVIYRLEEKTSFLKGRSFCPRCRHFLKWYDLIPVLSFIMLRAKCRYCKNKISFQYPLVEFFTGALFLLIFWHLTFGLDLPPLASLAFGGAFGIWILDFFYLAVTASLLVVVFVYDLKHFIIPDKIIYPAIGIALLYKILEEFKFQVSSFKYALIAAALAAGFFFLIWAVSGGKWLGFGDVKLAFFMGLFLGFPNILTSLFFGFFIGAIIGLGLILLGKKKLKSEVPFGPFLITGTFIALFWGERIVNWYLSLL